MGKSLNLDTLRCFIDSKEKDAAALFKGLKLEKSPVWDQLGTHPVISLNFRDFKLDNMMESFTDVVKYQAKKYLDPDQMSPALKQDVLPLDAIKIFCRDVEAATGQKTFIIIDEYDKLYMDSAKESPEAYDQARNFTKNVMSSCLKDNPHLFKAVITGVNRIAQESMFSDLNNIEVFGVFRKTEFDQDFGFSEEEVAALIDDKEELDKVRKWYNGYRVGGSKIYFTYSVMSYLKNREFETYWGQSGTIDLIKGALNFERIEQITKAITNGGFYELVNDRLTGEDLNGFKREGSFYSLLVQTGYLTHDKTETSEVFELNTPNVELERVWERFILDSVYNEKPFVITDALKSITNIDTFQYNFHKLLSNRLSYFDFDADEPEKTYHVYVLGMLAAVGVKIKSNKESGSGRYDLFANYNGVNYIFEFKKAADVDSLEAACTEGIQQIRDKGYAAELDNDDPTYLVGIGFVGKKNLVRAESL
jgi:hypothetical protein